jgi:arylsulfatase
MIVALIVFTAFITARARAVPIISILGQQRSGEGVPARKKGESRAYCFDDRKMLPYYTPKEKDWYTTDYFTKWAIDFLEEYKNEDKPYFLYVSYTAPHDPLHAWPEDIAKYEGVYDKGYEAIRNARFKRQKENGALRAGSHPH